MLKAWDNLEHHPRSWEVIFGVNVVEIMLGHAIAGGVAKRAVCRQAAAPVITPVPNVVIEASVDVAFGMKLAMHLL